MMNPRAPLPIAEGVCRSADYDVVVIGGAFSGSSSAVLLKRQFADLRVLVIERTTEFSRKVGESTSEVAGCFLTRVLRVGMHLNTLHLTKHGLRMWFHKAAADRAAGRSTEIGPSGQSRLPTFQLNRVTLDAELLEEARRAGCEIVRPATIKEIELGGIGKNVVTFKTDAGEVRTVTAGWVIDASGKAAKIAKMRKTWRSNEAHPTASLWTRFKNVTNMDSVEGVRQMEGVCRKVTSQRSAATNHLMGYGWWCWIIPLGSGEVSAGITWDTRLFIPPSGGKVADRVKEHLLSHPVGRMMFEHAEAVENDNCYYKELAYYSEEVAGRGWTAVGDACGFMDPLYSQGLDFCAHTVYSSYALLRTYYTGGSVEGGITMRNKEFKRSYFDWFNALYKDKYWYLGDAELMHAAFLMDVSTYFIGPVRAVYGDEDVEFQRMPYYGPAGHAFASFMAFYNRRLVKLAKKKIIAGTYGARNLDEHFLLRASFVADSSSFRLLFQGIRIWLKQEVRLAFTPALKEPVAPSAVTPLPEAGYDEHAEDRRESHGGAAHESHAS